MIFQRGRAQPPTSYYYYVGSDSMVTIATSPGLVAARGSGKIDTGAGADRGGSCHRWQLNMFANVVDLPSGKP